MSKYYKVSATPVAAVATNSTLTFGYPAGVTNTTAGPVADIKAWFDGLGNMADEGNSTFTVAYTSSSVITLTYKGSTSIPAGSRVDLFVPLPEYGAGSIDVQPNIAQTTDSTGGTPGDTVAAITAPAANATTSLSADMGAVKNGLASIVAKLNAVQTALEKAGITVAS
jgi:hypothetical protein